MDIDCDGQHPLLNTPVKLHCVLCWLVHSCMLSSSVCLQEASLLVVGVMDNFDNSLLVSSTFATNDTSLLVVVFENAVQQIGLPQTVDAPPQYITIYRSISQYITKIGLPQSFQKQHTNQSQQAGHVPWQQHTNQSQQAGHLPWQQ